VFPEGEGGEGKGKFTLEGEISGEAYEPGSSKNGFVYGGRDITRKRTLHGFGSGDSPRLGDTVSNIHLRNR
jgi:hypothetical protein